MHQCLAPPWRSPTSVGKLLWPSFPTNGALELYQRQSLLIYEQSKTFTTRGLPISNVLLIQWWCVCKDILTISDSKWTHQEAQESYLFRALLSFRHPRDVVCPRVQYLRISWLALLCGKAKPDWDILAKYSPGVISEMKSWSTFHRSRFLISFNTICLENIIVFIVNN